METTTKSSYSPVSVVSHWLLALSFLVAYTTVFPFWIHFLAGFIFCAVLVFKLVRLFASNDAANIKAYSLSPKGLVAYVKKLKNGIKESFTSHNPISSFNSIALYASAAVTVIAGIVFFAAKEVLVLPRDVTHDIKEVHELFANLTLAFVVLHICGVLADKYLFKGEAYRLMLKAKLPSSISEMVWGLGLLLALGAAAYAFGVISKKPELPSGQEYALYKKECASCHFAYPANLYTKASWESMMDTLENHYGEDATIADDKHQKITEYLLANSIETGKSKQAYFLKNVDIASIGTIVKDEKFKKKHRHFDAKKTKLADCSSCHTDAESGRFALVNIREQEQNKTAKK